MPASPRKPLHDYSEMDSSQSSSSSPRTRSQGTAESRQRSASPKKRSPSPLYPYRDLAQVSQEYDPHYPRHIRPVYPNIDNERAQADNFIHLASRSGYRNQRSTENEEVIEETERYVNESRNSPTKPKPPPRRNVRTTAAAGSGTDREIVDGKVLSEPLLWTIVGAVVFSIVAFLLRNQVASWLNRPPTDDQLALEHFHQGFQNFTRDFKHDLHPDSLRVLRNALEHHVEISADAKHQYPTCILLAGDQTGSKTLNCLAGRIAELIPARNVPVKHAIHTVDLTDDSHLHKKDPDHEDLRSRVHSGINEGINEGAKIIVFRNLEALIPKDIPLLQLFYSYCDGENPTFPKTLWILTVGTENVSYAEEHDSEKEPKDFHRRLGRRVEDFLENILEGQKAGTDSADQTKQRTSGNPILTRIANYIIPVLKADKPVGVC